ncbi:MAG: tetratricopeptide repeat protein [Bacteroidia bacterium]
MYRLCFIFLLLFAIPDQFAAQQVGIEAEPSSDEQLAAQFYQAGDYEKAMVYYEKLYEKNPIALYYNYYLNCLINTSNFKKAEKLVKKQAGRNPFDLRFKVDMGRVYRAEGNEEKAKKEFDNAVNSISGGTSATTIIDLTNAFLGINESGYAIKALEKGRKELKGIYTFHIELAEVYAFRKEYPQMINEYLGLLEVSPAYKQQVQNLLQAKMDEDTEGKIAGLLKTDLIRRTQKDADKIVWAELLMWLYMQEKNFSGALIQAKAIDKRKELDGEDVMSLAATARQNGEYRVANDAYDYVIGLGKNGMNYYRAKMEKMNTRYEQVTSFPVPGQAELVALETEMNAALADLGKNNLTVPLIRSLAHLKAFYMNNTKGAIQLLEEANSLPGIKPVEQALCKLELGDILVLDGQIWEASLKYAQVEKDFKFETIGQEAKFRNAKVYFYAGDFEWAQAQLDVLKGATSKLISNDAMYLSLLITENLALDSNPEPLMWFAQADLMLFQNKYKEASNYLDSIDKDYTGHSLSDDVLFMRYRIAYKKQNWNEASGFLNQILEKYPADVLGDDAMYRLAELYDYKIGDQQKAMQYYQDLILKYPGSLFVVDARKRFRQLRGDKLSE